MVPGLRVLARFSTLVEGMAQPPDPDVCWVWEGSHNSRGYGKLSLWRGGTWYAHRVAYGLEHGHVPPELDHLCRNRSCWRPSHLESVTHQENMHRSPQCRPTEMCRAGHVWAEVGWWVQRDGSRKCKECHRRSARESARRRLA